MNQRDAKQLACAFAANFINAKLGTTGQFVSDKDWTREDESMIENALEDLQDELERRGDVPDALAEQYPELKQGFLKSFVDDDTDSPSL